MEGFVEQVFPLDRGEPQAFRQAISDRGIGNPETVRSGFNAERQRGHKIPLLVEVRFFQPEEDTAGMKEAKSQRNTVDFYIGIISRNRCVLVVDMLILVFSGKSNPAVWRPVEIGTPQPHLTTMSSR